MNDITDNEDMLEWLIDHLHVIQVNTYAAYCDDQKCEAVAFKSIDVEPNPRPWKIKGDSRDRLKEAIFMKMIQAKKPVEK